MSAPKRPTPSEVDGGVVAPKGFMASGIKAGIKKNKPDLALLFSQSEASVAGLFTTNKMAAAPVLLCQERIATNGKIRAVIVNSGNANACTGKEGKKDAMAMVQRTAEALGVFLRHQIGTIDGVRRSETFVNLDNTRGQTASL